ncbi:hypothetical protein [Nocardiopsis sp. NPDC006938]|uniref:hypothetical protein n=1 Tax=Nocardiopsis sp. NPDC006938 TaxID=3364337 RepID=UPI0036A17CD2
MATLALAAATLVGGTLLTAVPAQAEQVREVETQAVLCRYIVKVDVSAIKERPSKTAPFVRYLYRNHTVLATEAQTNGFRYLREGEWIPVSDLAKLDVNCLN